MKILLLVVFSLGSVSAQSLSYLHARRDFPAGPAPESVALGDLNGDGQVDAVVAGESGSVSVLLGNGDGTFQAPVSYPVGVGPYGIAVADLNHDGKPDLAVANEDGDTVSVL